MGELKRVVRALFKHRYLMAALSVAGVATLRYALHPLLADIAPMLLFFAAVAFSAWQGFGPGLFATLASALIGAVAFTEPAFIVHVGDWHDELRLLLFVLEGAVISALGGLARRRKRALDLSLAETKRSYQQLSIVEREASENELRFRQLTEAVPHIVWTANAPGCFDFVNQRWSQITGLDDATARGLGWQEAVHPDDRGVIAAAFTASDAEGGLTPVEFRLLSKDGSYRWMLSRAVVQRGFRQLSWVGTFSDITDIKAAAKEMLLAKQSADQANAAKSRFVAHMSHEIRTPLGAIVGFAELLKGCEADAAERCLYLETIIRNGRHLTHLIDDILDLSKVEADRLEIDAAPTSLPALVGEVQALLAPQATAKGITLKVRIGKRVPPLCSTDPARLRQILINIIGNAVKFTDHGIVSLKVRLKAKRADGSHLLTFEVADTGRGISAAERERLFQPFTQADVSTTRKYGGTGLGLVLSRRLARLLGGDLQLASSTSGIGSTFVATVAVAPLEQAARSDYAKASTQRAKISLAGIEVLLAEDGKDVQLLIKTILSAYGASVAIAANGAEAVAKAIAGRYDIVLMDMQMPVMDGLEATRELRRQGWAQPIVALTAHAMKEERAACLAAGCNHHLIKPVDHGDLVALIHQLVNATPRRSLAPAASLERAHAALPQRRLADPARGDRAEGRRGDANPEHAALD